ncbi:hypothetical protein BDF19DRAFT_272078 [Syncephalis fuscata]|nr:hypothetical protein BDF19DRAFT_272078 [Syncephalis fuscata]
MWSRTLATTLRAAAKTQHRSSYSTIANNVTAKPHIVRFTSIVARTYSSAATASSSNKKYKPAFAVRRPNQPFPERKEYLFTHYRDIMSSNSRLAAGGVLVLQHNNMTSAELVNLRSELRAAFANTTAMVPMSTDTTDPNAILEVARVAIMRAAIPRQPSFDALRAWLCGPTCLVRLAAAPIDASNDATATTDPVPNAADPATIKRVLAALQKNRKLILLGGRFDAQWFSADGIRRVSDLPDIQTLRAELLALLSAPAQQLTSLLERVPSDLARTLEAHQKNLQEEQ